MEEYSKKDKYMARQVSIMDYLQSRGYACKRVGTNEYNFKDIGDSFFVNSQKNCFNWYSHSIGGGSIECLQEVFGMDENTAIRELIGDGSSPVNKYEKREWKQETKEKPTEFIPPEKSQNYKNLYAYLIKERMLDKDLVSEFVKCGILYQTTSEYTVDDKTYTNNNIVFLHKSEDGTVCGASEQGTKSGKRFKKNYEGTDKDFGFLYKKGYIPNKVVYLFEAPIDLMSFIQLHPEIENAHFVAMEGLKPSIAEHYINDDWRVYSCVDNDAAGKKFNDMILSQKMDEAFGGKCERASISDREPPIDIEYLKAEHNGKQINLFLSDEDYNNYKSIQRCESAACFVWKNKSEFSVITECKENGVKDFNDLLKMNSKSYEERMEKAWDNNTTPDELAKLAQDANVGVRTRVAANRRLPINVLKILAEDDESAKVRNTARKTLDFLAENSVEERLNIAFNPYTAAEELKKLAYDENARVRLQVANNPNTSMETLKKLVNDSALNVRQTAQNHIDFLTKNNGKNNRESEADGGSGIKDNLSDKLDEVADIADKISDAIDNGEMDREERSISQER